MIKSDEISVVIQGSVDDQIFSQTLPVIRNVFKDSELILSETNPLTDFEAYFNTIVRCPEIGSNNMTTGFDTFLTGKYGYEWKGIKSNSNLNRQLIKTKMGIDKATRKYVLKLRSDMIVSNLDWLSFYDEALDLIKPTKTKQPIICGNYRDVLKWEIFPYHYHDWFNFGLKEDVDLLFSAPLLPDTFDLSDRHLKQTESGERVFDLRSTPETYIGGRLFCKENEILFTPERVHKDMINHFVPIDLGLHYAWSLKFPQESLMENCIMSHASWKSYIKGGVK